jgi:predicted MFS family arabinose efflux permease
MILVAFAPAWSMTAVWIVVPAIAAEWRLGPGQVHWVASGFIAAMVPAMLTTPWLLQRLGVRHTALAGLAILAGGGWSGAVATSFEGLVIARLLEGIAAGVLQPLPVLVVARSFVAQARGRAMGMFTLGLTMAPALAPAVAGLLAEHLGWRSVLVSVAPLVLLAAAVVWHALPAGSTDRAKTTSHGRRPGPFGQTGFRRACFVAFVYGLTTFAGGYLVPVFLQVGLEQGASAAGAALLPSGLALALASPYGGRMADRWPRHRVIAVGMLVFGLSHLPLLTLTPAHWLGWMATCLVMSRLGMALALPSLALDALRGLPEADWAAASTMVSLARQLGAALGIAAASAFIAWRLALDAAVQQAFHESFLLVAAACALGALVAWRNGPASRD